MCIFCFIIGFLLGVYSCFKFFQRKSLIERYKACINCKWKKGDQ